MIYPPYLFSNATKPIVKSPVTTVVLAIAILLLSSVALDTQASEEPSFRGEGRQDGSGSGGSRGDECPETELGMMPLIPADLGGAWTTEATPTVWVYVPFAVTPDHTASFVIKDANGQTLHRQWLEDLPNQPGVLHLPFPTTASLPARPTDSDTPNIYTWQFNIFCDPLGGQPEHVVGSIQRIDPDQVTHPTEESALPHQLSAAYAQAGIWYDALTTLGNARLSDPYDSSVVEAWHELLSYSTVGLGAIANEPLMDCCTLTRDMEN